MSPRDYPTWSPSTTFAAPLPLLALPPPTFCRRHLLALSWQIWRKVHLQPRCQVSSAEIAKRPKQRCGAEPAAFAFASDAITRCIWHVQSGPTAVSSSARLARLLSAPTAIPPSRFGCAASVTSASAADAVMSSTSTQPLPCTRVFY